MKVIHRGAEAILYLEKDKIVKDRIKKSYRLPEIDEKLRKFRTKREAKLLMKKIIPVPEVFSAEKTKIQMEFLKGELVKDVLDNVSKEKRTEICKKIGKNISSLHDNSIIHGDLTTSNMILKDNNVYFIDFGLGSMSGKAEDKAVDLHLLKQALEARHHEHFEQCFKSILQSYKKSKDYKKVIQRLKKVESRGRYKKNE